jgi:Dyp-type peroxidase family
MANLETQDIQGIIITGYGHLSHSSYLFLHADDPARAKAWLAKIAPEITTGVEWPKGPDGKIQKPKFALNVAFTYKGLAAMGLMPESLATFSPEFIAGIAEEARSRRLGDTGDSAPANWEIGGSQSGEAESHVLLIVQGPQNEIETLCQMQIELAKSHSLRIVGEVQQGYLPDPDDDREHFGFNDAISQPKIEGSPIKDKSNQPVIKPGEFILGYPNEYELLPSSPTVPAGEDLHDNLKLAIAEPNERQQKDLGRNGSYLVFRKLHQDVAGFRRYIRDNFSELDRKLGAAKLVGRWPDGTPLVNSPDREDPANRLDNDFYYMEKDPRGYRCPLGSHIRRVNPRDSLGDNPQESIRSVNRHRLVRRGALYGEKLPPGIFEDDDKPRGVLFFCINANIQRQFEFVQQTWIENRQFNGLYDEKDPVLGSNDRSNMTIQRESVRQRLTNLPRFVSVKGGGYFFLPSISALYFLAGVKNPN